MSVGHRCGRVLRLFRVQDGQLQSLCGSPRPSQPFEVAVKFARSSKDSLGELMLKYSDFSLTHMR